MSLKMEDIKSLISGNEAVLLYFSTDRCAPCISLRPKVFDLLEKKFPKMKMELIDAEGSPEISAQFSVFASPTILLFFDGKETRRFSKYISVDELEESIDRYYKMIFD